MAQQHHDPTAGPVPADVLARHLRDRATEFLRALRLHRESGAGAASEDSAEAARALRRAARRISAGLYTFQPVLDPAWSQALGPELAWVSGTLSLEDACASRLNHLLLALHRLSGTPDTPPGVRLPPPRPTRRTPTSTATPEDPPAPADAPTPAPADGTPPDVTRPAPSASGAPAPRAPGTQPAAARRLGTSAAPPAPHASGAPAPADGTPPDVTRPAPSASGAPAPRATGTQPAVARRTGTVTATVPAPDDPHAADRRPEGNARPGGARAPRPSPGRGNLTVGAAKAGALLDRQLTLARTRAHSTALQALGSSRFHALADQVAVLASEVPLAPAADGADLRPLADAARERLADAVAALPLLTAGSPYNAEALVHGLSPDLAPHPQDAPWHQVRLLLRLHRYAREVLHGSDGPGDGPRLLAAGEALDRHRDAAEAAAAAAQAARTPRIAPATAYALGVLHADQRHEVEAARYAFQRAWQKPAADSP
ncbi:CHAD domain-containing protein [Streptomyces sp. NPDC093594]|uniref:CHAD domain-containing protein n=1 Tax=Streptomyces sp. NPDC093594 TaxID=3155305 RepID=UPI00344E039C